MKNFGGQARALTMTAGRPLGLLARFALPLMLQDALQQIYAVADGAVVGRMLGHNAFAAVKCGGRVLLFAARCH